MTDETEVKPEVKPGIKVSRQMLAASVLVLVIAGVAGLSYFTTHEKSKATVEPCTAGANERCPTDEWMKSYEEFQAAQAKLKSDMESKGITERQRMLAGWAQDLGNGIPTQEGYTFDEKLKKFTKPVLPPPAPVAPVVPPVIPPAPQAKK